MSVLQYAMAHFYLIITVGEIQHIVPFLYIGRKFILLFQVTPPVPDGFQTQGHIVSPM